MVLYIKMLTEMDTFRQGPGRPLEAPPGPLLASPGLSWLLLASPGLSWAFPGLSWPLLGLSWPLLASPGLSLTLGR
jgi:hypothetical protein